MYVTLQLSALNFICHFMAQALGCIMSLPSSRSALLLNNVVSAAGCHHPAWSVFHLEFYHIIYDRFGSFLNTTLNFPVDNISKMADVHPASRMAFVLLLEKGLGM